MNFLAEHVRRASLLVGGARFLVGGTSFAGREYVQVRTAFKSELASSKAAPSYRGQK